MDTYRDIVDIIIPVIVIGIGLLQAGLIMVKGLEFVDWSWWVVLSPILLMVSAVIAGLVYLFTQINVQ